MHIVHEVHTRMSKRRFPANRRDHKPPGYDAGDREGHSFYGKDGGVTLSGGEPLYQPGFTLEIFRKSKDLGITTVLDTSGCASPGIVREVMGFTDMVLLDIKHMDPELHRQEQGLTTG